jgi:hypothetical protein
MINGGSFSASSLISSNLKLQRVTLWRRNGGAFNGTVVDLLVELPHSELKIRIGLMMMAPHHKTEIKGRGFFQTRKLFLLEDRLKGNDPELSWILKDIKINK